MFVRTNAVEDNSDFQQIIAGQVREDPVTRDALPTAGLVGGNSDFRLKCVSPIRIV